ncbi:MAG: hypothetical protein ACFE9I_09535 [Candidatus Hermodarchaeota archaeon]
MEDKYSPEIQIEINEILNKINDCYNFFDLKIEFYFDGWAIFLREKNLYPRYIIIFKSYANSNYFIKSYEIHLRNYKKEEFKELYSLENIKNKEALLKELKEIIYGKDLIKNAIKIFNNTFLK